MTNLKIKREDIIDLYTPPCDEMSFVTIYQTQAWTSKVIAIQVVYPRQTFQEIVNKRAFGFESFWSSVGGFVGIFLGYSLMQLPEIIYKIIGNICSRRC